MIDKILSEAQNSVSKEKLKYFVENIYKSDNKPSFHAFHRTADWCVKEFQSMGLKARKVEFTADGKKNYGDWQMPKAWDAFSLIVKDLQTEEIIADYDKLSTHMVIGSGPTPEGGVTGECVYLDDLSTISKQNAGGKFIVTKSDPKSFKRQAKESGALAFLFHGKLEAFQGDAVRWVNAWADRQDQWLITADDTEFPGVSLSPNTIDFYKNKLEKGETVSFFVNINTKFYDGTQPVVEAILEGESTEEIFFTGHLFEQGANDNSSGCAGMLEMARILSQKKNKKTIRFLFTSEIYGTIPYCFEHQAEIKKCKISLNIDSIADYDRTDNKVHIYQNPDTNPSFVNVLLKEIIFRTKQEQKYSFKKFLLDDNLVADPQIGIPCALMAVCSYSWHTSIDTLEALNYDLFHLNTSICLTWAEIAANGENEAFQIIQALVNNYIKELKMKILDKQVSDNTLAFRDDILTEVAEGYQNDILSFFNKQPIQAATAKTESESGPTRTYYGAPSYRYVPKEDLKTLSMWSSKALMVLFLCNGKRSESRVIAYAEYLFDIQPETTIEILDALKRNNYIKTK